MKTPKISFADHNIIDVNLAGTEQVYIRLKDADVLAGGFCIKQETLQKLTLTRPHKALVITLTSGLYNETHNLTGDALTFVDDVTRMDDKVIGYFTVKLDTLFQLEFKQLAYITVSMADNLSNTLEIKSTWPR